MAYAALPSQIALPTGNPVGGVRRWGAGNGTVFVHTNPMLQPGGDGVVADNIGTPPAAATVPEGWRIGGASATGAAGIAVTCDKSGIDADGFPAWRIALSGTLADATSYTLQMFQTAQVPGHLTAASRRRGVGRVAVAPGSVGLEAVWLRAMVQSGDSAARTQQSVANAG